MSRFGMGIVCGLALLLAGASTGPVWAARDDVAVIIGNKDYKQSRIPPVNFALRDAAAMKKYVTEVLKYPPENVIYLENATQGDLTSAFGNEKDHRGRLWRYLDPAGGSNVTIFYSGHGVPGQRDKRGYLLPVNADPNTVEINGYPIDVLYSNLAKLKTKSVTVYLDACFSGESSAGMLLQDASPFGIKVDMPTTEKKNSLTVLTAATGSQIASWDRDAKHGLFTRHLLEGLYGKADSDGDKAITVSEIKAHLDRHMTRAARRIYGRIQDATVKGSDNTVVAALPQKAPEATAGLLPAASPKDQEKALGLSRKQRRDVQRWLTALGFNTRGIDGLFGRGTRKAVRGYQRRSGLPKTGYLDKETYAALRSEGEKKVAADRKAAEKPRRERQAAGFSAPSGNRGRSGRGSRSSNDSGFGFSDDFSYSKNTRSSGSGGTPKLMDEEAAYWHGIKNSRRIDDFRAYLSRYPAGRFEREAWRKLAELTASR